MAPGELYNSETLECSVAQCSGVMWWVAYGDWQETMVGGECLPGPYQCALALKRCGHRG